MTATLAFLREHLFGRYVADISETPDGQTIIITSRPIGHRSERHCAITVANLVGELSAFEVLDGSRVLAEIAAAKRNDAEGRVA